MAYTEYPWISTEELGCYAIYITYMLPHHCVCANGCAHVSWVFVLDGFSSNVLKTHRLSNNVHNSDNSSHQMRKLSVAARFQQIIKGNKIYMWQRTCTRVDHRYVIFLSSNFGIHDAKPIWNHSNSKWTTCELNFEICRTVPRFNNEMYLEKCP